MKDLYDIKDMLFEELHEIASKGELSAGVLEIVHKLTDTIKNIDKICMLEEGGYSHDGGYNQNGNSYGYSGNRYSGRRGGRGNSYDDGGYDNGDSYANRGKHYVRAHYSRDDGRSYMMEQLEDMMNGAGTDKEREAIKRCMRQLENA